MQLDSVQTQLADVMHVISQALLIPVIVILLAFIGYALFCIGSIVAETLGERRHFKVHTPAFLKALMDAPCAELPKVIEASGLLNRQKIALLTVYDYRSLPDDALVALVRRLVGEEEARYRRIVDRNNAAAKISPMVGLMGTLIPLGPGVAALGQGATTTLSSSLLIAFDTTVAGLIVAALCLAIGKIRSNWYDDYMSALDSAMATMLQKIEQLTEDGELPDAQPSDYAERFKRKVAAAKGNKGTSHQGERKAADVTTQDAAASPSPRARTDNDDSAELEQLANMAAKLQENPASHGKEA